MHRPSGVQVAYLNNLSRIRASKAQSSCASGLASCSTSCASSLPFQQQQQRWFGTHSPPSTRAVTGEVPAGHLNSDLTRATCHIGLSRLRDLTLRQDLCLWEGQTKRSLNEMFKGKKIIVVGFPAGPFEDRHALRFTLLKSERERVSWRAACRARGDAAILNGKENEVKKSILHDEQCALRRIQQSVLRILRLWVELLADGNGGFVRMLGFELGIAEGSGPKCQRFAGIVDDGILLKVRLESTPIELKSTDCKSMLEVWDEVVLKKK
ncbi:peroxiredoxin type II [Dunaliella salina]|uniref:Peroxiredoxin type II n=1 Tax=Dunaliella salina TaxID=3046 RepID=A0ABQ7GCE2_DUNSA|nr:peroxiredoxin type II [Dunaliella salina]|eukprot:KAF5832264.1 peroxiredoxin type II [Dunaliella salina]